MTKPPKDQDAPAKPESESADFPDASDSCDFGYVLIQKLDKPAEQ